VRAGRVGRLDAAHIRRQRLHRQAGDAHRRLDDRQRVGHLRDDAGRHEAANLDLAQAGPGEGGDPADFGVGRHARLGHLQPVARRDLAKAHMLCHGAFP
jgi:hypothetical protein